MIKLLIAENDRPRGSAVRDRFLLGDANRAQPPSLELELTNDADAKDAAGAMPLALRRQSAHLPSQPVAFARPQHHILPNSPCIRHMLSQLRDPTLVAV